MSKVVPDKSKQRQRSPRRYKLCRIMWSFLLKLVLSVRYLVDLLIDKLFGLFYGSRKWQIAECTNPIILESATSLARKIRKRQLTVTEVVTAFVARIKEVNPVLNAVVDNRFVAALNEACQLDMDINAGFITDADFEKKPFLGVPFTSKESTAAKGLSHTFGLMCRMGRKSNYDATVVERMRGGGAILLGVTNIPQLNLWQETLNPVYGTTNNPYDLTRNVGGSSGGESSIIAAGGSPLGVGTDIGGSVRIPAFMCGIFGHKTTCDIISTRGLTFRTGKEIGQTMVSAGPMSRHAEDLIPALKVMAEPQNLGKLRLDDPVSIKNIQVYYVENPRDVFVSPFRAEMKEIFMRVVRYLEDVVPEPPQKVHFEEMKHGGKLWRYWMTQEPEANFNRDLMDRKDELKSLKEIVRYFFGLSQYNAAVILNLLNGLLPKTNAEWAKSQTESLTKKLLEKLGPNGVLLYPSAPFPARHHHTALLRPWNFNLFGIWNALKFPVTQVPLGLSKDGLPLGIQIVSTPHNDRLCIEVAKELEKGFGGHVPPFKIKN